MPVKDIETPPPGPCGGRTVWNKWPRRHWCKLSDEDVAFLLLSGGVVLETWTQKIEGNMEREDAWEPPFLIALRQPDGRLSAVCYHSKCRWVKESPQQETPKNKRKSKKAKA